MSAFFHPGMGDLQEEEGEAKTHKKCSAKTRFLMFRTRKTQKYKEKTTFEYPVANSSCNPTQTSSESISERLNRLRQQRVVT